MSRWDKLPDEKRDHWPAAYEWVFVRPAPQAAWTGMERFRQDAGITDRLIVKAIEIAHAEAGGSLFAYATEILSRCAADEVTTVEQYEASQALRTAAREQRAQDRAAANVRPIRKEKPRGNVFLHREGQPAQDDSRYEHIYNRFGAN